jgi:hypothetical protein
MRPPGFHPRVEAEPVLFGKIEAAQSGHLGPDAVVPQRHGVTPTSNLGDDGARSVGCGIHRDKRVQTIAPDSGPQLCGQDVAEPDLALLLSTTVSKYRFGSLPAKIVLDATTGVFKGQNAGAAA